MATIQPPKRARESDDEEDVQDQLVDPALVGESTRRKRGRPPGSGKKKDAPGIGDAPEAPPAGQEGVAADPTTATTAASTTTGEPNPPPVKRGRGRPKKIKTPEELAAEEAKKNRPPAKRGRPRKKPKPDEEAPVAIDAAPAA